MELGGDGEDAAELEDTESGHLSAAAAAGEVAADIKRLPPIIINIRHKLPYI